MLFYVILWSARSVFAKIEKKKLGYNSNQKWDWCMWSSLLEWKWFASHLHSFFLLPATWISMRADPNYPRNKNQITMDLAFFFRLQVLQSLKCLQEYNFAVCGFWENRQTFLPQKFQSVAHGSIIVIVN